MRVSLVTAVRIQCVASRSSFLLGLLAFCLSVIPVRAEELPLYDGERVSYDLYFKWGVLMPRAGTAYFDMRTATWEGKNAWHYRLLFHTTGMIDRFFPMRDTLNTYLDGADARVLFSSKRTDEGDYYLIDDLRFRYDKPSEVAAHSLRTHWEQVKVDTTLTAEGLAFDMLGGAFYLRSLDWERMTLGQVYPFCIFIGRDVVKAQFRYTGQQVVTRGDLRYRTRHFYIDIFDEAFTQAKEAAEVWMGDDENRLPIRVRAKLKIGAAEVYLREAERTRYPLRCRVTVPEK